MTAITAADLELHAVLGIPADLLTRAHVRRLTDRDTRELLSLNGKPGDLAGIEYPYVDPRTGHRVTSRVRLDHPPLNPDGTAAGKYRAAYGDRRHLYFPPGITDLLVNPAVPVVIVEAEKSALAITAAAERAHRPVLALACGGCWGFRGVRGKTENAAGRRVDEHGALTDFDILTWTGRPVIVCFDARPNASVNAARTALARELRSRGADVRHGRLPDDPLINGPDDLVAQRGDKSLWTVIDTASPEAFVRNSGGRILTTSLDNVRLAISKIGVVPRYNEFARQVCVHDAPLEDIVVDRLWAEIDDRFRFRPSKDLVRTVLTLQADAHRVHPVREYLDSLVWDETPRLDGWLTTYAHAEDSAYVRAVGMLPLIAAVRRVRQPGSKFDELLVLESPQGTGKSSAIRTLCAHEDWFSDDLPLGVDSKQVIERTCGKWIIEASEMYGNRGRESEQLKAFLSRQTDGPVRLAYAHLPVTVPRQFVMIGTTNARAAYLKDATGARRFWPVTVQGFDLEALERDRDQLWAEAAAWEAHGTSIRLDRYLWDAAGEQQEQRRAVDPWEHLLEPVLEDADAVSVETIWTTLGVEASHRDNRHADRVAQILQRHGFTEKRKNRFTASRLGSGAADDRPGVPSAFRADLLIFPSVPSVPSVPTIAIEADRRRDARGYRDGRNARHGRNGAVLSRKPRMCSERSLGNARHARPLEQRTKLRERGFFERTRYPIVHRQLGRNRDRELTHEGKSEEAK